MRPSKIKNYMDMAEIVSRRSHDSETKVGAILVNNTSGAILSTGFNGFVRGTKDDLLPTTRPEKYEYIVHAEANLVTNCARHGIATNDCIIVCTMSPCKYCMRLLVNCGITKVICQELYKDFEDIRQMKDVSICISDKDENGFWHITYKV